jgi:hypothetical protein
MRIVSQSPRVAGPRRESFLGGVVGDRCAAKTLLGEHHPLVDVLCRIQTVVEQSLVGAATLASSLLAWWAGEPVGPSLATAAAALQIALGCRLALLIQRRRDVCASMIIGGGERLPLTVIEFERDRLASLRLRVRLARSIEDLAEAADRLHVRPRGPRPIFDVNVVRPLAPQLHELARVLRTDAASVRGVALTEQLMTSGASVLYGADREALRRELGRASYLLCQQSEPFAADREE